MSEQEQDDPLLTPEEVAQMTRLHTSTILNRMKNGDLKGFKNGRRWFVRRSVLNDWLKSKERNRAMTAEQPTPEEIAGELPVLERRKLDAHSQAYVTANGRVVISSAQNGIETVLSPERAYALLDLLYSHRDRLYQQTQWQAGRK